MKNNGFERMDADVLYINTQYCPTLSAGESSLLAAESTLHLLPRKGRRLPGYLRNVYAVNVARCNFIALLHV